MKRSSVTLMIVLALAIATGLATGCGGFPDGSPAKVGDVYIDGDDFTTQVDSYAAQYGISKETDPDIYNDLASSILEGLVATELAVQSAGDLGITVTDEEVQDSVDTIINDYYDGDQEMLEKDLETDSMDMDDLRKQVRDYIAAGLVQEQITQGIDDPTDEEIQAYYDENMADFMTGETISARHILVAAGNKTVRSSATTTTESTTTTTDPSESADEVAPTTSTESTTTTTLPEIDWAQALATAAQVRVDLLEGGSWTRLAARYSDDLDTKDDGGDLGVVTMGSLTDTLGNEFENALYSLDVDQISEPIRTEHGYELIQVTKTNEPVQMTLEEAREEVILVLTSMAQEEAWFAFIDEAAEKIGVTYRDEYQPTTTTEAVIDTEQDDTTTSP